MNGFVSVGPAILNDHAVNYRNLAAELPDDRILVETDMQADDASGPDRLKTLSSIYGKLAALRNVAQDALEELVAANARRMLALMV